MAETFVKQLLNGCHRAGLVEGRVLVGLSGGPDSVALVRGLLQLRDTLNLELMAAHLNHELRGGESREDEEWCRQFCEQFHVPLKVERRDISTFARDKQIGIEEAARRARHDFLIEAARESGCHAIALAHHADDQAETILHHVLRGTGLRGLAGMKWERALDEQLKLVRPMLGIRRSEIEVALREWKQDSRMDSTNSETHYTRNRLRHELIPMLERDFNPQVTEAILSLGRQAEESDRLIRSLAKELLRAALIETATRSCRINKLAFVDKPRHLVREAFVQLWRQQDWPRQQMNFNQWDRLAGIALGEAEGGTFPGPIDVKRVRRELHLTRR
ncbi:MAG: tRNA lysidine(34) synthetase TilS [Planctomyces sp.]|nr:tRNA lysidine(34) synthetase TilS [Planctomyces sp.]